MKPIHNLWAVLIDPYVSSSIRTKLSWLLLWEVSSTSLKIQNQVEWGITRNDEIT